MQFVCAINVCGYFHLIILKIMKLLAYKNLGEEHKVLLPLSSLSTCKISYKIFSRIGF
jgi:hypothetical protein